ncbi:hypothetical protein [Polyangium fumosum]|nr:hypothetical protein [Polyangium fumosum]
MSLYGLGCMADPEEMSADPEDVVVREALGYAGGDPGTANHLRPVVLMNHGVQETTRALGKAALVNTNAYLPAMPYMPSASATGEMAGARQEFLEVLIGCALPDGVYVYDPGHVERYIYFNGSFFPVYKKYFGDVGLAPEWTNRKLELQEKQWVTACVLARTNRYGETIQILLEGSHPALAHTEDELAEYPYPVRESKTWGNMFDSTVTLSTTDPSVSPSALPFTAYICSDPQIPVLAPDALFRECDAMDACGFNYMGECCVPTPWHVCPITFTATIRASVKQEDVHVPFPDLPAGWTPVIP